MNIKGIIFDLDGTLLNSIEDLAESMNIVLNNNGFPTHEIHIYEKFIGNGILSLVKNALPDSHNDEDTIIEYFDSMYEIYTSNCTNKTKPYDGVSELLEVLTSRNIKIAVLSNKADELTKKAVDTLLSNWNFESIHGLTEETTKKPNPIKALEICEAMGNSPKEMIFVGDSGIDIETGVNAGMITIGVTWGFRSKEELIQSGADHIIDHPLDLLEILEKTQNSSF